ncbi:hypothetical protein VP1G_06304 [Cytospora mali]|uniref:Zn(2)-C6 fungal-type domain-containing protein n=1 Tax=Cytospora mali TaxID=578113 RepID=A0A194V566_CYTMA|nr:hypothetical protein VP1G_06304 [Valsa mali var. pyri (nom. inval.)]
MEMEATVPEKRPRSPPRRQRACFNCSTAKARCNFKDENIGKYCDRCHRMGVECVAQPTRSLRRPRKLTGTVTRGTSLGRSIDGIVSLLGSNHIPGPQGSAQNFGIVTTTGPTSSSAQALQSTSTPELSRQERSVQTSISSQASRASSSSAGHSQTPLRPHFQQQRQQQRGDNPGIQGLSPQPGYGLTWPLANDALENFRTNFLPNFPFVVTSIASIWLHYNYALIKLYEPATCLQDRSGDTSSHRSQCLHYCLQAVTSFFAAMISLPARSLLYRPFVAFAELVSAIVAASRLLLLEAEGWSVEEARQTLDLPGVLGAFIAQFETVNTLEKQRRQSHQQSVSGADRGGTDAADEETVWEEYIEKLNAMKKWYGTNAGTPGPFYPTEVVSEGPPEDHWASLEGTGDQFWLGLLGNDF